MIVRRTMRINHWQRIVGGMVFKVLGLEARHAACADLGCRVYSSSRYRLKSLYFCIRQLIHSRKSTHLSPASRLPCTSVSALEPLKNATILITNSTGSVLNKFQLV
jgi:hypothetical protein